MIPVYRIMRCLALLLIVGCKTHATGSLREADSLQGASSPVGSHDAATRALIGKHPELHRGPADILHPSDTIVR